MTVQELINELKGFPPELKVVTTDEQFRTPVKLTYRRGAVWIETKYDGDYDRYQQAYWIYRNADIEKYNEEIERLAIESANLIRKGKLPFRED